MIGEGVSYHSLVLGFGLRILGSFRGYLGKILGGLCICLDLQGTLERGIGLASDLLGACLELERAGGEHLGRIRVRRSDGGVALGERIRFVRQIGGFL